MLTFLPSFLVGIIAIILFAINITFIPMLVVVFGLMRSILPFSSWQKKMDWFIQNVLVVNWIRGNNFVIWLTTKTYWDIKGTGALRKNRHYFLICNHQSWADILILQKFFGVRVSLLVFFMKKQLRWSLPIAGWTCWALGFPFMERPSKDYLRKHPEKKGFDIEATKKSCQRFKNHPVTVVSFLEGTRFTSEKKLKQHSPYQHLLKPKATTIAFALATMGDAIHHIINTTIIYPEGKPNLWHFVCGRIKKVIVRYEVTSVAPELKGDYENDRAFRVQFQNLLNELWQEKDNLITDEMDKSKK